MSTTRVGGFSQGPWHGFNLGLSCGDDDDHVRANRRMLREALPAEPVWLRQVHGTAVWDADSDQGAEAFADAAVSRIPGTVLAVLSADCLPLLLCDRSGAQVAVAHAGWRGLAGGVIEATVDTMQQPAHELLAWLGPAIGGGVYEVGGEVRTAFADRGLAGPEIVDRAFRPSADRWLLDLEAAARAVLAAVGVTQVYGGGFCTYRDAGRFFSHRRDGVTGRMASLIWIEKHHSSHE